MKLRVSNPFRSQISAIAALLVVTSAPSAFAATFFWDADGDVSGSTGGTGFWDNSSLLWRDGSASGTLSLWPNANPSNVDIAQLSGSAGTLTLNSSSVNMNVNRINFGTTGYIIAGPVSGTATLNLSGTTPTIDTGALSATISANISGSSLTKVGLGTLTLKGTNTFTGGLTIKAGSVGSDNGGGGGNFLGGGTVTIGDTANTGLAANLNFNGSNFISTNTISIVGNGAASISVSGWSQILNGAVTLSNNLTVSANNSFGSSLTFGGGMGGTGNLVIQGNAVGGITFQTNALNMTGTITNNGTTGGGSANTAISAQIGTNVTGVIQNSVNSQLNLSGNNSYNGVTTLTIGNLNITSNNALGSTTGSTTIAATGRSSDGGILNLSNNITSPENITITGATENAYYGSAISSTSGNNVLSGNITLSGTGGIRLGANGGTLRFSGNISQSGTSHGLAFIGGNAITVDNAIALNGGVLQVYSSGSVTLKGVNGVGGIGNTVVSQSGVLKLGVSEALNTTGNLEIGVNAGDIGTFDLTGFNQTVNALNSSVTTAANAKLTNSVAGTKTLTVGNGGGSGTFRGVIQTGTGQVELVKTGIGNQTLNATNTSTGGTRIDEGILTLGHTTDTLANGGAVNVNGGTLALGGNSDTVGAVTLTTGSITGSGAGTLTGTGSAFDVRSGTISAKLGGTIGLDKTTSGTVTLSGINTYSGVTTVSAGTLELAHNDAAGTSAGGIAVSGSSAAILQINSGITTGDSITFSNTDGLSSVKRLVAANNGANNTDDYTIGTTGLLKSQFSGGQADTNTKILAGTNSRASAATLEMKFSGSVIAANDSVRRSDIFTTTGTGTDTYVLQLTTDVFGGLTPDSKLAWLSEGSWTYAGTTFYANTVFAGLGTHALGSFGYDSTNQSVWAVVNTTGSFAAIPEPNSAFVGLLIGAGLLRRRRTLHGGL